MLANNIVSFLWELRDLADGGEHFQELIDLTDRRVIVMPEEGSVLFSDIAEWMSEQFVTSQDSNASNDTKAKLCQLVGDTNGLQQAVTKCEEILKTLEDSDQKLNVPYKMMDYSLTRIKTKGIRYALANPLIIRY